MELIENNTKTYKNTNRSNFFVLLKNSKIETAINNYFLNDILVDYNDKTHFMSKKTWIKYLKKTILNKFTEVKQFKIEETTDENEETSFKIFMICKKVNGTLDFTEVLVTNNWIDNCINKLQYRLISH